MAPEALLMNKRKAQYRLYWLHPSVVQGSLVTRTWEVQEWEVMGVLCKTVPTLEALGVPRPSVAPGDQAQVISLGLRDQSLALLAQG